MKHSNIIFNEFKYLEEKYVLHVDVIGFSLVLFGFFKKISRRHMVQLLENLC